MKLNLTASFIVACVIGALTIVGLVVLDVAHVQDPGFLGNAGTILATLTAFASVLRETGTIKANVNGNLTSLIKLATQNPAVPNDAVQKAADATGLNVIVPDTAPATAPEGPTA